MQFKPTPKLVLKENDDGLHQTLDTIVSTLNNAPERVAAAPARENLQPQKQAVLTYFAQLMSGLFAEIQNWQALPLPEAQKAFDDYVSGTVQQLPPKLKIRFTSRAKVYGQALFSVMAAQSAHAEETQNHKAFAALLHALENAVLMAVKLSEADQEQVIATAFADYHHALVAGVEAGLIGKENAELMAETLQKELLLVSVAQAVAQSPSPVLLALQIADGQTGDAELDALPPQKRRMFLEALFTEETHDQA